jgi:hypothetical protein
MQMPSVIQGTTVRFYTSTPFTSVTGTVVDPDVVTFAFSVQGAAPHQWTYGVGSTIVKDAVGTYHADIDTTPYGAGVWVYTWAGWPNGGSDATKTKTLAEGELRVNPASITITGET